MQHCHYQPIDEPAGPAAEEEADVDLGLRGRTAVVAAGRSGLASTRASLVTGTAIQVDGGTVESLL